jgi:hypothetical protein
MTRGRDDLVASSRRASRYTISGFRVEIVQFASL